MPFRFGTDKAGGGLAVTKYIEKPSETEVYVPDGTEVIGSGAFSGCGSIQRVVLPGSVRRIMSYAFADCRSLTGIELGGTAEIGRGAFSGCTRLRRVYLPDSVRAVRSEAFQGCLSLKELRLPAKRPEELSGISPGCPVTELTVGDMVFTAAAGRTAMNDRLTFMYNCIEREGYLLRRFYGMDIDEGFLFGFACELYTFSHPDAAAFIEARYDDILRYGVRNADIGIVRLLLGLRGADAVSDELIDLAANSGSHEVYLMLMAVRHGEAADADGERFSL